MRRFNGIHVLSILLLQFIICSLLFSSRKTKQKSNDDNSSNNNKSLLGGPENCVCGDTRTAYILSKNINCMWFEDVCRVDYRRKQNPRGSHQFTHSPSLLPRNLIYVWFYIDLPIKLSYIITMLHVLSKIQTIRKMSEHFW